MIYRFVLWWVCIIHAACVKYVFQSYMSWICCKLSGRLHRILCRNVCCTDVRQEKNFFAKSGDGIYKARVHLPISQTPPVCTRWEFAHILHSKKWDIHWGRDKMAIIFQTTFLNAFPWMQIYELRLRFHWSLFLRVQLTIFQHWFR